MENKVNKISSESKTLISKEINETQGEKEKTKTKNSPVSLTDQEFQNDKRENRGRRKG